MTTEELFKIYEEIERCVTITELINVGKTVDPNGVTFNETIMLSCLLKLKKIEIILSIVTKQPIKSIEPEPPPMPNYDNILHFRKKGNNEKK